MKSRIALAFIILLAMAAGGWLLLRSAAGGDAEPGARAGAAGGGAGAEGYTVSGRVVGPEGEPVVAALVTAGALEQRTDGDGFFSFSGLPAGELILDAAADGYLSPGPPGLRGLRLTLAGTEQGATVVDGVELTLRRPGRLSGRVVAGRAPIAAGLGLVYAGAEGLAGPLEPFSLEEVGASGADGRFEITVVAPGRLRVGAEAADYSAAESREIYLRDGEEIDDLVIDLLPSGVVRGLVQDAAHVAVAGAEVIAAGALLPRSLRTRSDAAGRFAFDALPAGSITLSARAAGYRGAALDGVEVVAGEPRQVELTLEQAQGLFGRVIDRDGAGVTLAYVVVQLRAQTEVLRSDAEGYFMWAEAPDQEVELTGISPYHAPSPARSARPGQEAILQLGPGGAVEGRVVDTAGAPVSRFTVAVESFEVEGFAPYGNRAFQPYEGARSDGRFTLGPLRPGAYQLRAWASGYARGDAGPVEVAADKLTGGVIIRLGRGAVVRGTVSDDKGVAVAGARVTLFDPLGPFDARSVTTSREGDYTLRGVPAGRRSLKVTAPRYLTEIAAGLEVPEAGEVWRDVTLTRTSRGGGFSFHGIGAVLQDHPDGVRVMQTLPDQPASLHGLRPGDIIVEVDREPTRDLRLDQIIERIRGEEGVPVELEIERAGEGRFTVELERGRVVVRER